MAVLFLIMRGSQPPRPTEEDCYGNVISEEPWGFANDCWEASPGDRPEMADIIGRLVELQVAISANPNLDS
jgi:hypothetical protein